jgi:hypothetical protein
MLQTRKKLLGIYYSTIIVCLIIIVLYETDILPDGIWSLQKNAEFSVLSCMELITICFIPLSLRLFKFRKIRAQFTQNSDLAFSRYATIRISMLCLPMLVNVLLYYLFMNVAFGYMGIILFLTLFFIYPSIQRCKSETSVE